MKTTVIIFGVGLVVAIAVGGWNMTAVHRCNRALQTVNQSLETELRVAQSMADTLRAEKEAATEQLALAQDATKLIQTRPIGSEAANSNPPPPDVKPYQVPAYLGQTFLGQVWVVPRNLHMDTNAQRYVYEPVVVLDERLRQNFVTHHTNVVEREVVREVATTYVDNNYYPQPVYYYVTPTHRPGSNYFPRPPQAPVPQPAPKFNPGSGTITPQKLGTPDSTIKTRPSP